MEEVDQKTAKKIIEEYSDEDQKGYIFKVDLVCIFLNALLS